MVLAASPPLNMNHSEYNQRLNYVRTTLRQRYGLEPVAIEPIDYDPECPFPYNNFIYRVELPQPNQGAKDAEAQPGTSPMPENSQYLVMRLNNAAAGLNDQNRIQNEVASMALAREALRPRHLVPMVYGWQSGDHGQGWILMEHMPGNPLDVAFDAMSTDEQRIGLQQLATILRDLHQVSLPKTTQEFGGLCFDSEEISPPDL
jgi:hypothetical protein